MDASKIILHKAQTAGKRARNKKFTTLCMQVQRESKSINIGERRADDKRGKPLIAVQDARKIQ